MKKTEQTREELMQIVRRGFHTILDNINSGTEYSSAYPQAVGHLQAILVRALSGDIAGALSALCDEDAGKPRDEYGTVKR